MGFRIEIVRKDTYGMTQMEYGLKTSRREERSGKKLKRKDYEKKEEIGRDFSCIDPYD